MEENMKLRLQLFADGAAGDGGSGGDGGAAPGAESGKAARLRELGVPEAAVDKHLRRTGNKEQAAEPAAEAIPAEETPQSEAVATDVHNHFDTIHRQAREMGQKYPGFDLQKELENPTFFHLTSPYVGLSVEDAYMAVHHREVVQAITQGARQDFANAVRAKGVRPAEHGIGAKAPGVVTFDYKNATRSEREAFKKRIYDAAARGEKIYPNV